MTEIHITIEGDEEFAEAMSKLPDELVTAMEAAGKEAHAEILGTVGIQQYPPATAANFPPAPYYQRGKGTIYPSGRSDNRSEQYGKRWNTVAEGYKAVSTNTASYAKYLVSDEEQAFAMWKISDSMEASKCSIPLRSSSISPTDLSEAVLLVFIAPLKE